MTKHILLTSLVICIMPWAANAGIIYRVQQAETPSLNTGNNDRDALASQKRFYVGGAYNFSIWSDYTDKNNLTLTGKDKSSFEVMAGLRIYDTFRIEANYVHTNAKWNKVSLTGDTVFLNAIFDARIDSLYRLFQTQMLVPYVGFGAGITWNNRASGDNIKNTTTATLGALAGISVEFNQTFAMDFGYRYFYIFSPEFETFSDMSPSAHQLRAGARIHF
ncbi:MAG: outer membrane beta-barrel protein [Alphaproteobacteria bacterium]|nr:outer membrane beta-barrel protein [Alphaproteobacteria bacterium]